MIGQARACCSFPPLLPVPHPRPLLGFQSKENFKKKYTGGAWHAAVDFVNKALAMYRRYSYTH